MRQLSAGQKKRAALARLLLLAADVWLLDEPFANLDREGIALVNRLIERHAAHGGAAMVTSHGAVTFLHGEPRRLRLSRMTPDSLSAACAAVLRRDLLLAWRRRGDIAMPVLYALIVATLFPFALGPDPPCWRAWPAAWCWSPCCCRCCWPSTPCSARTWRTARWNS